MGVPLQPMAAAASPPGAGGLAAGPPTTSSILSTGHHAAHKGSKGLAPLLSPMGKSREKENNCLENQEMCKQHVLQGLL